MPPPLVDAGPVVAHFRYLMAQGMGYKDVAETAGVSPHTVGNLLYGLRGARAKPVTRLRRETAEKLLAASWARSPGWIAEMRRGLAEALALAQSRPRDDIAHLKSE